MNDESLILEGLGLQVATRDFSPASQAILRAWARIPPTLRENFFFKGLRTDILLQKTLQRCLNGPKPLRMRFLNGTLGGFSFEAASSHKYFLMGTSYEHELQAILRELVGSADVVYDIGAHFGWWTLWFSRKCQTVIAFEPSAANFSALRINIESNGCPNVVLRNLALSDQDGELSFIESGSSSRLVTAGGAPYVTVSTIRLDHLGDRPEPTLLKIDVEGFAGHVLEGAHSLLESKRPTVVCEIHDREEDSSVRRTLESKGYCIEQLELPTKFPHHILAHADGTRQTI